MTNLCNRDRENLSTQRSDMPASTESRKSVLNFPLDLMILLFNPVLLMVLLSSIFSLGSEGWLMTFGASMIVLVLGAMMLSYAKWPLYRSNRFLEFGAGAISAQRKRAYMWAWRLIAVGAFFAVWLVMLGNLRFSLGML